MKILISFFLLFFFTAAQNFDYSAFDKLLKKIVVNGSVNYKLLQEEYSTDLRKIVKQFAKISPRNMPGLFPTETEKLVYWINAYNVSILRLITEEYPVKSIKKIYGFLGLGGELVWIKDIHKLGGEDYSFNDIEHEILRKEFKEPRIHFAVNCASKGCPDLQNFAFTADKIEEQFSVAIQSFFKTDHHFRLDTVNKTVLVNQIFDWFKEDFYDEDKEETIIDYLISISDSILMEKLNTAKNENYQIEYIDYNWDLNNSH